MQAPCPDPMRDDLQAALEGSACLGVWSYDMRADRFALAPALADVLGLDREDGAASAGFARALATVHPEDRLRVENILHAACETELPFEAELRIRAARGENRFLRLMGRCDRDAVRGSILARGLAFDLTERRRARGTPAERAHRQVNQLADHVIAMQGLVSDLRNPPLSQLVDRVAVEVGFELARRLRAAEGDPRH